jgi:pilus assembly protein CpaB
MEQRGGCLWLLVGLFLALIAGGLAFTAMLRATSAESGGEPEPRAPVVIVARDVPPRTELTAEDLITKEIPLSAVPENAVREQDSAVGQVTTSQLIAGEILLQPRIAEPGEQQGGRIQFEIEAGKVAMAVPATDLMSLTGILEPGDVIDFLYTVDVEEQPDTTGGNSQATVDTVTFWSLQQVPITAVVLSTAGSGGETRAGQAPQAYVLALDPQDALLLKHLKDTGAIVDIVLRAREDTTEFETVPVNPDYVEERFDLKQ